MSTAKHTVILATILLATAFAPVAIESQDEETLITRQLAGTWYGEATSHNTWDGKAFGTKSGREIDCTDCCVQDVKLNLRLLLHPEKGVDGVILTGRYDTIVNATGVPYKSPDNSMTTSARWIVTCPPSPHGEQYTRKGEAVIYLRSRNVSLKNVEDNGDIENYELTLTSPSLLERRAIDGTVRVFRKKQ